MRKVRAETAVVIAEGKEFQRETVAGKNDPSLRTEEQGGKAREWEFRKE